MKKLLIVESPAKAKTIGKYLGSDFCVKSSIGHIRDLPKDDKAIQITETGNGTWSFIPTYVVSEGKEKVVKELMTAVKSASAIYLASDPDREGEAIAWHLKEVLQNVAGTKPFHRVSYNEITKSAVLKAVAEPREIDMPRVDAQQARRILDRLVGYRVSPLLWHNINIVNNRTLSAGRVQSVALRLLVERQNEIDSFKPETYYLMGVEAKKPGDAFSFVAKLARFDNEKPDIKTRELADAIVLDLINAKLRVSALKAQPKTRHALPPFTTSTLQQAASSVLGFSPGATMKLAQDLYERGVITYMRSDSVNISDQARAAAKSFIVDSFGSSYYPEKPNIFASKAKNGVAAQEAHEAIRPTDVRLTPQTAGLEARELKLYDLIWRRFVASQMADAKTTVRTLHMVAEKPAIAHSYEFTASATDIDFEGFLKVMKLSLKKKRADGEDDDETDEVAKLPVVSVGNLLDAIRWISDEKQTKGPTHYSEASLIKALEENGVGRPSTYAATIETLKTRGYALTEKKKLVPTDRGKIVCEWLVHNMDRLFNVGFTAEMETQLDKIEENGEPMNAMLSDFYREFLASMPPPPKPPESAKFELVFSLLGQITQWTPPKKIGKRVYDDYAFYKSCLRQFQQGTRQMSSRQLEFLARMAMQYKDQIPNCEQTLREAGLNGGMHGAEKADPKMTKFCFDALEKMPELGHNSFIRSLREQYERGRSLSMKQYVILARTIVERADEADNADEIREKLANYITTEPQEPKEEVKADPAIPELIKLIDEIKRWRPPTRKGKKLYDDSVFVKSIKEQYERRHTLSTKQVMAIRRVLRVYYEQVPDYAEKKQALGLLEPNTARAEKISKRRAAKAKNGDKAE